MSHSERALQAENLDIYIYILVTLLTRVINLLKVNYPSSKNTRVFERGSRRTWELVRRLARSMRHRARPFARSCGSIAVIAFALPKSRKLRFAIFLTLLAPTTLARSVF